MNAQAPAGWYPDGQGNERYWDGSAWTEQLRHPEVADATSAASSSAQKEGAFSKLRKVAADKHAEKRSAREELDRKQADDAHAEVVHVDPDRLPGWFPFAAGGGVVADEFLFLDVDTDHGVPGGLERAGAGVEVGELRVTVGVLFSLDRLSVGLQAVAGAPNLTNYCASPKFMGMD